MTAREGKASMPIRGVRREIEYTASVQHENVVQLIDFFTEEGMAVIVWELISGPDLLDLLNERGGRLSEPDAAYYFSQLLRGVCFIHERGLCHRDLKPENVMIDRASQRVKIIDFGLSKRQQSAVTLGVGTPDYMAPELLGNGSVTTLYERTTGVYDAQRIDIWALGVLLYLLITGLYPFEDPLHPQNVVATLQNIIHGRMRPLPRRVSRACADLILAMLTPDPRARITLQGIARHPWLVTRGDPEAADAALAAAAEAAAAAAAREASTPAHQPQQDEGMDGVVMETSTPPSTPQYSEGGPTPNASPSAISLRGGTPPAFDAWEGALQEGGQASLRGGRGSDAAASPPNPTKQDPHQRLGTSSEAEGSFQLAARFGRGDPELGQGESPMHSASSHRGDSPLLGSHQDNDFHAQSSPHPRKSSRHASLTSAESLDSRMSFSFGGGGAGAKHVTPRATPVLGPALTPPHEHAMAPRAGDRDQIMRLLPPGAGASDGGMGGGSGGASDAAAQAAASSEARGLRLGTLCRMWFGAAAAPLDDCGM